MIVNIYALNVGVPSFIKQTLLDLKAQTGPDTVIVGNFNTPLSSTDSTDQKEKKKLPSQTEPLSK
jgi:hypothetical protein